MSEAVFKQSVVDSLKSTINQNLSKYISEDECWISDHFGDRSLYANTKLPDLPDDLLLIPDGSNLYDRENSERFYEFLSGLTPAQAADPRLWTYLTHVKYWKYMKARWPIADIGDNPEQITAKSNKRVGTITSRYFLMGDKARGLTRNGISRLWWAGYTCHDRSLKDQYSYAKALFANQEVHASLMERAFSKNRGIIQPVLSVLTTHFENGNPFDEREKIRDLGKYLVLLGGAMVLDVLSPQEIKNIVVKFIDDMAILEEG